MPSLGAEKAFREALNLFTRNNKAFRCTWEALCFERRFRQLRVTVRNKFRMGKPK